MNCGEAIRAGRWRLSTPLPVLPFLPLAPQEFENPEGEDCSGEYTPPAEETSSSQSLPDVYILPLAEVSLPMPAPQPAHSGTAPSTPGCCGPNPEGCLLWLREGRGQNPRFMEVTYRGATRTILQKTTDLESPAGWPQGHQPRSQPGKPAYKLTNQSWS